MTLFVDKQKITGKETEQLFSAGISLFAQQGISGCLFMLQPYF